jgi:hypothetical protein
MANGYLEKFDKRVTIRMDNNVNRAFSNEFDSVPIGYPDIVRACMIEAENAFVLDPGLIRILLKEWEESGKLSGDLIRRDVMFTASFKEYFSRLAFKLGYDLNEYILASLDHCSCMFKKRPRYAAYLYDRWVKINAARTVSPESNSPKQMTISAVSSDVSTKVNIRNCSD